MKRISALFVFILLLMASPLLASSWTAFHIPEWEGPPSDGDPSDIIFNFENGVLSLNTPSVSVGGGGSSTRIWQLLFSGNWAVCGSIDSSGQLVPDEYATFVTDGAGGHIVWKADTPHGHTTSLLLGHSFIGDAAATYYDYVYDERTGVSTTGTLMLWNSLARRPLEDDRYLALSHEFTVTSAPEPSGILAVMAFAGLAGASVFRRSLNRRNTE